MDDLISRAAAIEAVKRLHGGCITDDVKNFVEYQILSVPAVDAVPVVRCKDCKYYNTTGCCAGFGWCEDTVINTGVFDNFYCAYGERRESK